MTSITASRSAILPRAELRQALAFAVKVAPRRTNNPILSNVLVRQHGDSVAVVASDLDCELTTVLPGAVCDAGFATTLPAFMLRDVERKALASDEMEIHKTETESAVLGFAGLACTMATRDVADFPELRIEGKITADFACPTIDLLEALQATAFAISTEETRYYLNGVHLHAFREEGRTHLRAVATDGHRMAVHELFMSPEDELSGMPGIIVPRTTVALLIDLCKAKGAPATVQIKVNTVKAVFTIGTVSLVTTLIDGTFPDYARVIPMGNEKHITVDPRALASAIKAVMAMSAERAKGVKLAIKTADDGRGDLVVSVNNPDTGRASMTIACDSRLSMDFEIGFNGAYLLEILAHLDDHKRIAMQFGDEGSPALFSTGPGSASRFVLMPMRV